MPVITVVINNAARITIINNNNDGLPGGLQLPPDEATPVRRAVYGAECAASGLGRSEVQVDERKPSSDRGALSPCEQRTMAPLWFPEGGEGGLRFFGSEVKARAG